MAALHVQRHWLTQHGLQHNIIQLSQMLRLELRRLGQLVPHVAPRRAKALSTAALRHAAVQRHCHCMHCILSGIVIKHSPVALAQLDTIRQASPGEQRGGTHASYKFVNCDAVDRGDERANGHGPEWHRRAGSKRSGSCIASRWTIGNERGL